MSEQDDIDPFIVGLPLDQRLALFVNELFECSQMGLDIRPKDVTELAKENGIWRDDGFAALWSVAWQAKCANVDAELYVPPNPPPAV